MILGIYGSGGEGREVKETAVCERKWDEIVYIDDTVEEGVFDGCKRMPFERFCKEFRQNEAETIIALGEPKFRSLLYEKVKNAGYAFANVIHPTAIISPTAILGHGITAKAGVVISASVVIGNNIGIGVHTTISHDSIIGNHVQISPHVAIAGHCTIGNDTFIGLNASIRENIKIGSHSVIGMGAVVTKNVPDYTIVYGNPAKIRRSSVGERVFKS